MNSPTDLSRVESNWTLTVGGMGVGIHRPSRVRSTPCESSCFLVLCRQCIIKEIYSIVKFYPNVLHTFMWNCRLRWRIRKMSVQPVNTKRFEFGIFSYFTPNTLASGSRVRGFKPGRSRWIFSDVKILNMPSFGGEVK
jgi:hypothetical protein